MEIYAVERYAGKDPFRGNNKFVVWAYYRKLKSAKKEADRLQKEYQSEGVLYNEPYFGAYVSIITLRE